MTPFIKLSLPLFLILALVQPAIAKEGSEKKGSDIEVGEDPGHSLKEALKSLGLSEEQKAKIKELRKSTSESNKKIHAKLKEGRKAMEDLMKNDGKKDEILSKFESLQTLRGKMARARFEMMLLVREILNPDQRKKFREFMEKHKMRKSENHKEED